MAFGFSTVLRTSSALPSQFALRSSTCALNFIRLNHTMVSTAPEKTVVPRVLDFWFGNSKGRYEMSPELMKVWYAGGPELDDEIKSKFGADVEAALDGKYDMLVDGSDGVRGNLALVILLDQFTRNIFRKDPKAFSGDGKAIEIAAKTLESRKEEVHKELRIVEQSFMLTPFMHSEDLKIQNKGIAFYEKFLTDVSAEGEKAKPCLELIQIGVRSAKEHRDLITKFGRFPHRNDVLERNSTPDELEYLKTAKRYGQ